jgi:hypothetical protein
MISEDLVVITYWVKMVNLKRQEAVNNHTNCATLFLLLLCAIMSLLFLELRDLTALLLDLLNVKKVV